jgi:hypothetical protein
MVSQFALERQSRKGDGVVAFARNVARDLTKERDELGLCVPQGRSLNGPEIERRESTCAAAAGAFDEVELDDGGKGGDLGAELFKGHSGLSGMALI